MLLMKWHMILVSHPRALTLYNHPIFYNWLKPFIINFLHNALRQIPIYQTNLTARWFFHLRHAFSKSNTVMPTTTQAAHTYNYDD